MLRVAIVGLGGFIALLVLASLVSDLLVGNAAPGMAIAVFFWLVVAMPLLFLPNERPTRQALKSFFMIGRFPGGPG